MSVEVVVDEGNNAKWVVDKDDTLLWGKSDAGDEVVPFKGPIWLKYAISDGPVVPMMSSFAWSGLASGGVVAPEPWDESLCGNCRRDKHSAPLTEQVAAMIDSHRFSENYSAATDTSRIVCPGSDEYGPALPKNQAPAYGMTGTILDGIISWPNPVLPNAAGWFSYQEHFAPSSWTVTVENIYDSFKILFPEPVTVSTWLSGDDAEPVGFWDGPKMLEAAKELAPDDLVTETELAPPEIADDFVAQVNQQLNNGYPTKKGKKK